MMRIISYILSVFFLVFLSCSISAQNLTNPESRKLNTMVLDIIDRYEDFSGVYDEDSEYEFLRLFQRPDVPVYAGDLLLGYSHKESLPASEYAVKLLDFAQNVSVSISKVRKEQPYYEDGLWYVPVRLQKSVEYTDGSLILSSDVYYEDKFDLTLLMACDLENDRCRISSIVGSIDSDKVFPMNFLVIRKPERSYSNLSLEDMLTVDGRKLEYNRLDYAIVPEGGLDTDDFNEMKYEVRIDSEVVDSTFRHKEVVYDFEKTRGRFKIRNKFAPMSAYKMTAVPEGISDKSWSYELGFDLGFGVPVGPTGGSRFGLFIGAALNYSSLVLTNTGLEYDYVLGSYNSNASAGSSLVGQTEYRFSLNSVAENISFLDIMVPLYMSLDHRLGRKGRVWLNWNLGVKAYVNTGDFLNLDNSSYFAEGNLVVRDVINAQTMYNENFNGEYYQFLSPCSYSKSFIELSAAANAALHIRLSRSAFLTLGAGYELGLTDSHVASRTDYYKSGSLYPFVTDAYDNVVASHSMYESVSFKRQALWLDLGFMFKF